VLPVCSFPEHALATANRKRALVPSILITGVSTGIGRACANLFSEQGWAVTGTLRDTARPPEGLHADVALEQLDLSVPGSAAALADRMLAASGCPDVLLNNAGIVQFGAVEDVTAEQFANIYQVNLFGQLELIRALLPAMRDRRRGTIANVTSLGGTLTFPFFSAYNSTKWAFEGVSEGLWHELKPFGIRVKAIEPGFVETAIWSKALPSRATGAAQGAATDEVKGPYAEYLRAMLDFEAGITERTTPEAAALQIAAAIADDSDRLRYPVAAYARPMVAARRVMGAQAFMRFFHRRWMGPNAL
jgi:NAD(P)-dependent dehydrogenase (short-subunit alcohol dehydrogenase family)